jgi:hypothetical protein
LFYGPPHTIAASRNALRFTPPTLDGPGGFRSRTRVLKIWKQIFGLLNAKLFAGPMHIQQQMRTGYELFDRERKYWGLSETASGLAH